MKNVLFTGIIALCVNSMDAYGQVSIAYVDLQAIVRV